MFELNATGNAKPGKIGLHDERLFPIISHLECKLTDTDRAAVEAIVAKDPAATWDDVARQIGITTRQLFNIRRKPEVQEACHLLTKELFKGDLPDVLKTLASKAKAGEAWAVRLFLEMVGEVRPRHETTEAEDLPLFGFPIDHSTLKV